LAHFSTTTISELFLRPSISDFYAAWYPDFFFLLGWQPDITAPGVDVIAAYSAEVSATSLPFDDRRVPYNILSGTSMACPHVAGIAGLIKAKYPDWSPAMIKSAIMTTGERSSTTTRTTLIFSIEPCSPVYIYSVLFLCTTQHPPEQTTTAKFRTKVACLPPHSATARAMQTLP
jgi:hypothetical protein